MHPPRWLPLLVAAAIGACEAEDGGLALREHDAAPTGGQGGGAGAGGAAGVGGGAGTLSLAGAAGQGADGGGPDAEVDATPPPEEPDGARLLRVLHGVVDAPRVLVCLADWDGARAAPRGAPLPLDWAAAASWPELLAASAAGDTRPFVLAGELALVEGQDCAAALATAHRLGAPDRSFLAADGGLDGGLALDAAADAPPDAVTDGAAPDAGDGSAAADAADGGTSPDGAGPPDAPADVGADVAVDAGVDAPVDAGVDAPVDAGVDAAADGWVAPPPLRVAWLPVIPRDALAAGRSYLLVPYGCIGGEGITGPLDTLVCGTGYTPTTPTFGVALVTLSRLTDAARPSFQALHASRATDALDLRLTRSAEAGAATRTIASTLRRGGIAPWPPRALDVADVTADSSLEVLLQYTSAPSLTTPLADALGAGAPGVSAGTNTIVVLLGPRPGMAAANFWNGPRLVALPAD